MKQRFARWYLHRARLYSLACGILQDRDQASDAVQDAFLKAYGSLNGYRGAGVFGAWLRKILVNQCLSVLRQRHRHLSLDELDGTPASPYEGPEAQLMAKDEAGAIHLAMKQLPAHYRAALVLRIIENLSYREIARLLSVPESTVESWIDRGRMKMRALLRPGPVAPTGRADRPQATAGLAARLLHEEKPR